MKVLVIPDIHLRKFWREVIKEYANQVDKVVFLGDYLDPYSSEPRETLEEDAISMLNDIVDLKKNEPDKYVLLIGNHCMHYIWHDAVESTRMAKGRIWIDYHNFFIDNLKYFNLAYTEDNTIFTHAGITLGWANGNVFDMAKKLENISLEEFKDISLLNNISYYRGGYDKSGSCLWADLREHLEITDYDDCNGYKPLGDSDYFQVFGHTQVRKPLINDLWACLDCRKGFIVENHEITECHIHS